MEIEKIAVGNGIALPKEESRRAIKAARDSLEKTKGNLGSTLAEVEEAKAALAKSLEEGAQVLTEEGLTILRQAARFGALEQAIPTHGVDCHIPEGMQAAIAEIRDEYQKFVESDAGQQAGKALLGSHLVHGRLEKVANSFGRRDGIPTVRTAAIMASDAESVRGELDALARQQDEYLAGIESEKLETA